MIPREVRMNSYERAPDRGRRTVVELSVDVDAAPERVWAVMMEVERWCEWTPSVRRIDRLEKGELAPGKAVRICQPHLLPVVWRVSEFVPGERFTWSNRIPGLASSASHRVERRGNGSRVTLAVEHSGALAWLARGWISRVTLRYVALEANGLKARCERRLGPFGDSLSSAAPLRWSDGPPRRTRLGHASDPLTAEQFRACRWSGARSSMHPERRPPCA